MAGGKTSAKKSQLAERRQKALSFRKAGASYRAIAQQVGGELGLSNYNESQAYKDVSAALADLTQNTRLVAESYRELELERLDLAMLAISRDVQRGDLAAIDRWIKLSESRRKLLGLDAPVQVQIEERLEAELEQFVSQLESVLPTETFTQVLRAIATVENRSQAAGTN